jgi:hypothetical protein
MRWQRSKNRQSRIEIIFIYRLLRLKKRRQGLAVNPASSRAVWISGLFTYSNVQPA